MAPGGEHRRTPVCGGLRGGGPGHGRPRRGAGPGLGAPAGPVRGPETGGGQPAVSERKRPLGARPVVWYRPGRLIVGWPRGESRAMSARARARIRWHDGGRERPGCTPSAHWPYPEGLRYDGPVKCDQLYSWSPSGFESRGETRASGSDGRTLPGEPGSTAMPTEAQRGVRPGAAGPAPGRRPGPARLGCVTRLSGSGRRRPHDRVRRRCGRRG